MRVKMPGPGARFLAATVTVTCFAIGCVLSARAQTVQVLAEPIYRGPQDTGCIALVVNVDWGEEYLTPMLDICGDRQARLTFFITGRWALTHPALVDLISASGHEIGNHGYAHPHPDSLGVQDNLQDIQRAEDALVSITGKKPRFFAPPYGERGPAVLEAAETLGYATVLWTTDTVDWSCQDADVIRHRAVTGASPGCIVLMHPTRATVAALPGIIDDLRAKRLEITTVSGMLGIPAAP